MVRLASLSLQLTNRDIDQTTILAKKLHELNVDLLDVSSGGNDVRQEIHVGPSYRELARSTQDKEADGAEVPFAAHVRKNVPGLLVSAVGIITESAQANDIIEDGEADVIMIARELLRHIDFPLQAALELGAAVQPAVQYER